MGLCVSVKRKVGAYSIKKSFTLAEHNDLKNSEPCALAQLFASQHVQQPSL